MDLIGIYVGVIFAFALFLSVRRYLDLLREIRAFVFVKRLDHLRRWNSELFLESVDLANAYAREYKACRLACLRKEYRAYLKRHHEGSAFSFRISALMLGYSEKEPAPGGVTGIYNPDI